MGKSTNTEPSMRKVPPDKLKTIVIVPRVQRFDKQLLKLQNKVSKIKVVKFALNTVLKKRHHRHNVREVTHVFSKISFLAYSLLNFHILRVFKNDLAIPDLSKQGWYNQLICSSCPLPKKGKNKDPEEDPDQPKKKSKVPKDLDLLESAKLFKSYIPESFIVPDRKYLGMIQNFMCVDFKTAVQNHLELLLFNRVNCYLKVKDKVTDACLRKYIIRNIFEGHSGYPSKFDTNEQARDLVPKYQKVFEDIITIQKESEDDPDQDEDDEDDEEDNTGTKNGNKSEKLRVLLRHYFRMLKDVEDLEGKKWSLLPTKSSYVDGYITVSTSCLPNLLQRFGLKDYKEIEKMKGIGEDMWETLFNIPDRNGTYDFSGTIKTNGYDVSVHYTKLTNEFKTEMEKKNVKYQLLSLEEKIKVLKDRNKDIQKENNKKKKAYEKLKKEREKARKENKDNKKEDLEEKGMDKELLERCKVYMRNENVRLFGNDPGDRNLYTMVEEVLDENMKIKTNIRQCSGRRFKHETGMIKTREGINRRKDLPQNKEIHVELQKYSLKTSYLETYVTNLRGVLGVSEKMFELYKDVYYCKKKFTTYIKRQLMYNKICKGLNDYGCPIIIGWGNGVGSRKGIKGQKSPCKELRKMVEMKCPQVLIVDVDEHLTTKMCSSCESKTCEIHKYEYEEDGFTKTKRVKIYGLRRCENNECRITWDRDVNGSLNILLILKSMLSSERRPAYLERKRKVASSSETSSGSKRVLNITKKVTKEPS